MRGLVKFADAAVDLDKVVAVSDGLIFTEGGHLFAIGKKATTAIVNAMPPLQKGRKSDGSGKSRKRQWQPNQEELVCGMRGSD
ncbi:MAG: hypothetical protein ILO10_02875 [Kiritimatiellae bacterium]|nr:hypothetical protein [Kiritimatiellia bacterium]